LRLEQPDIAGVAPLRRLRVDLAIVQACLVAAILGMIAPPAQSATTPPNLNIRIIGTASFQGRFTAYIEDQNTQEPAFYRVGDPIYGYKITEISASGVTVSKAGQAYVVPFQSAALHARVTGDDNKVVVANTYLPDKPPPARPNYYLASVPVPKGTEWDKYTPVRRPAQGGGEVASSGSGLFSMPLRNYKRMSSGYGYRNHPIRGGRRMHSGMDLAARKGTPIYAAAAGTVTWSGWRGGYGKCVTIDHQNQYQSIYGHCSTLHAQAGDNVDRGDLIGYVGSTGNSTGPHLHFEVRKNNDPVNPQRFLPDL
jgi:murein DD-endopeptidase MepM/ murein hydrolase activator NlpD